MAQLLRASTFANLQPRAGVVLRRVEFLNCVIAVRSAPRRVSSERKAVNCLPDLSLIFTSWRRGAVTLSANLATQLNSIAESITCYTPNALLETLRH